jgi:hypothetical protein
LPQQILLPLTLFPQIRPLSFPQILEGFSLSLPTILNHPWPGLLFSKSLQVILLPLSKVLTNVLLPLDQLLTIALLSLP